MTTDSTTAADRLAKLGRHLPDAPSAFAAYVPAVETGNLLLLSRMLATAGDQHIAGAWELSAHNACGATTAPDGRRMSINVEVLGGSLMVQQYIEEIGQPDHLRLVSNSDVFMPTGRTKVGVIWDLSVKKIDDQTCDFTNLVHSSATPELLDFLGKQGIPWEVFQAARKPISEAHNRQETPGFAKSIERHALRNK